MLIFKDLWITHLKSRGVEKHPSITKKHEILGLVIAVIPKKNSQDTQLINLLFLCLSGLLSFPMLCLQDTSDDQY